ncbi:hypothetical protein PIB30_035930 [Stylosanthes scabra]|uniref:Uncharacterized protein n=1 Tax=Stylosanthes scabra TaxID=79078 RepID=A0ABU6YC06_9FABA|nr:hypothetical protein [Stylosanthes scabra]
MKSFTVGRVLIDTPQWEQIHEDLIFKAGKAEYDMFVKEFGGEIYNVQTHPYNISNQDIVGDSSDGKGDSKNSVDVDGGSEEEGNSKLVDEAEESRDGIEDEDNNDFVGPIINETMDGGMGKGAPINSEIRVYENAEITNGLKIDGPVEVSNENCEPTGENRVHYKQMAFEIVLEVPKEVVNRVEGSHWVGPNKNLALGERLVSVEESMNGNVVEVGNGPGLEAVKASNPHGDIENNSSGSCPFSLGFGPCNSSRHVHGNPEWVCRNDNWETESLSSPNPECEEEERETGMIVTRLGAEKKLSKQKPFAKRVALTLIDVKMKSFSSQGWRISTGEEENVDTKTGKTRRTMTVVV